MKEFLSIAFVVLTLFQPLLLPVLGLKCYECTSEQPGCTDMSSGSLYEKECVPGAVGCICYKYAWDFVIGSFFVRSCYYEQDKDSCLGGKLPNRESGSFPAGYPLYFTCLKNARNGTNLPPPLAPKNEPPGEAAMWVYKITAGNLSNSATNLVSIGVDGSIEKANTPDLKNIYCYYCEQETKDKSESDDYFGYYASDTLDNYKYESKKPHCGSTYPLPIVNCRQAYGCATLWEQRHRQVVTTHTDQWNYTYTRTNNYWSSKIWMGCWYPGDQKCLRFPSLADGARSGSSGKKAEDDSSECKNAYERGLWDKEDLIWSGLKSIRTAKDYNNYFQCRDNVRKAAGQKSDELSKMDSQEEIEKWDGTSPYARIRFRFCGPNEKCNEAPEPAPPPTEAPSTTTTIEPFETTNRFVFGYDTAPTVKGIGEDNESEDPPKCDEDICFDSCHNEDRNDNKATTAEVIKILNCICIICIVFNQIILLNL